MSNRLEEIGRRKQALVEKAGRDRAELASAWNGIRSPLNLTSTLVGINRMLKTHPVVAAALSSFLVSGYASKLLKSSAEIFVFWRLARPLWDWWRRKRKAA